MNVFVCKQCQSCYETIHSQLACDLVYWHDIGKRKHPTNHIIAKISESFSLELTREMSVPFRAHHFMNDINFKLCKQCTHIVKNDNGYGCYVVWKNTSHLNDVIAGEKNGPFYMIKYSTRYEKLKKRFKITFPQHHDRGFNEKFEIPQSCPYILEHAIK